MSDPEEVPRITLMPDALTLIRIPKSNLDICTKPLIHLAFFNNSYVPTHPTLSHGASSCCGPECRIFVVRPQIRPPSH